MPSVIWDNTFFALCCIALFLRLLLQPFLINFDSLGQENIATLVNDFVLFAIALLFIIKKLAFYENVRMPKVIWLFGLFCLVASFSCLYSIDAPSSIHYAIDLWASFFFMFVLVNLLGSVRSVEIIIGVLIILMAIASAFAIYEYLVVLPQVLAHGIPDADRGTQELLNSHRPRTLFGWPNILAGFLVITLPLAVGSFLHARLRVIKYSLVISALLGVYALFVAMTVSSWIGLLASAFIFWVAMKKPSFDKKEKHRIFFLVFLICLLLTFTILKKMTFPGMNSIDARQQYFTSSLSLIKLHPFLGSGFRSYPVASAAYVRDINGRSFFVHNSYLQIWAELGIIGLIVYLNFLWLLSKDAVVLLNGRYRPIHWLACAVIAAVGGCVADNFFSYTMIKPQVSLFWWVLVALIIALKENSAPSVYRLKLQNTWKKLFLIAAMAGVVMTMRLTQAEYDFFTAVKFIHHGEKYALAQQLCQEAKRFNPWDKKFELARAYALYSSYILDPDIHLLLQARDAALSTKGQVSLDFEREALLTKINTYLNLKYIKE